MGMRWSERVAGQSRHVWSRSKGIGAFLLVAGVGIGGCGSIEPVAPSDQPITDPAQLYMRLQFNHPAVNLSTQQPYNTLRLVATPLDASGNAMDDLPAVTYASGDTNRVKVTSDGTVTALAPTSTAVPVVAKLSFGGVTHVDTAMVAVISTTPLTLDTLSIHPVSGPDSAVWALPPHVGDFQFVPALWYYAGLTAVVDQVVFGGNGPQLTARAVSTTGGTIPGLQVEYTSLDPAIATVDRWSGIASPVRDGQVRLVGRTFASGNAKADTVTYIVVPPYGISVVLNNHAMVIPAPRKGMAPDLLIRTGGMLLWYSPDGETATDVTFDDPTNVAALPPDVCSAAADLFGPATCGGGNVELDPGNGDFIAYRQFPVPGIYSYHMTALGLTGRVVVGDVIR